jgi:hypothetical protein
MDLHFVLTSRNISLLGATTFFWMALSRIISLLIYCLAECYSIYILTILPNVNLLHVILGNAVIPNAIVMNLAHLIVILFCVILLIIVFHSSKFFLPNATCNCHSVRLLILFESFCLISHSGLSFCHLLFFILPPFSVAFCRMPFACHYLLFWVTFCWISL